MNKLKLHFVGDQILREKAAPVAKVDDKIREILSEMEKIMRAESGAGLAAPQVGILKRMLIFLEIEKHGEKITVYKCVNPKIISCSEKRVAIDEGCLSVQGPDGPIFAGVDRPESVVAEWIDENGAMQKKEFSGYAARAIQHEIDHLDGILFIDYLSSAKREMVMRKVKKRHGN
jgi:peptide deformylase